MILNLAILYPYKFVSRYISWGFYWVIHVSYELLQFLKNTSQINPATYFYVSRSDDIVKWYLLWLSFRGFPRLSFRGFPLVFFVNFCCSFSHIVNYMKASNNHTSWTHIYRISEFFACHKIGENWENVIFLFVSGKRFAISKVSYFCVVNILLFKSYDRI